MSPAARSMMLATMPTREMKRYHHQYSLRRARPEKVAYLLSKTLLTAWLKDTTRS